jgi:hypothetical protein
LALGILTEGGRIIDLAFYQLRTGASTTLVEQALEELAIAGLLVAESAWRCPSCETLVPHHREECGECGSRRPTGAPLARTFERHHSPRGQRDPAAVFLIHGMNTLGDWQQSLSWRFQLLYGYSIPVFVFKFGRDLLSPLTKTSQRRRTRQLGTALRQVQQDLLAARRPHRCDVIAHSFGTLLITQLLEDVSFVDLEFGRIVLTGSIAPREFQWKRFVTSGRIEVALNHRA